MYDKEVHLAVHLTISDGALEVFEALAREMTAGSEKEPGTLGYEWFFSADRKRCRLLERYVDKAAVEAHFTGPVVGEFVPRMASFCSIELFEIYGDPGPLVAAMAGSFGAEVFTYSTGLSR